MSERTRLLLFLGVFVALWWLPVDSARFVGAVQESLVLTRWYAREHVVLCLIPALFIAGAIGVFLSQGAVMRYLGPAASRWVAYPVAAASGTILAVCSCTVLPLFASIHKRGAGLGPASAFLYSGPAINVLAIVLTARVLGWELGVARAVGAIVFSVVIGLCMHLLFAREEAERAEGGLVVPENDTPRRPWQDVVFFASMVGILVFANWGAPRAGDAGAWSAIHGAKWWVTGVFGLVLIGSIAAWFDRDELAEWTDSTWDFTKKIMPLLLAGVLVAGFLLGSPEGGPGIIPDHWIEGMVGGNSFGANLFAAVAGALMYFATLTEVPILEGLLRSGMGEGPALALLLAGPAVSLPNMLVVGSVLGVKKTAAFITLVVVFSTIAGMVYGAIA